VQGYPEKVYNGDFLTNGSLRKTVNIEVTLGQATSVKE
jgi:hypothetical protein